MTSSHISLVLSGSIPNAPTSVQVAERPVPNSNAPVGNEIERRSAFRDARGMVHGRQTYCDSLAERMRLVRAAAAARNTSGAEECEYSSRK